MENNDEWLACIESDLFHEEENNKKPTRTRRQWTPGFHEQVDCGVRSFDLAIGDGHVSVKLDYRANGTGSSVWDAAVALAKFLEIERDRQGPCDLRGLRVVEIGSGTGFVGLVAAKLGASEVTLTDLPECLDLMRLNAAGTCDVRSLPWGTTPTFIADVILCADCLLPGATHLFQPLAKTLVALLQPPHTYALVAFEERMDCSSFFGLLRDAGLEHIFFIAPSSHHPTFSDPGKIHIVRCSRKKFMETPPTKDPRPP